MPGEGAPRPSRTRHHGAALRRQMTRTSLTRQSESIWKTPPFNGESYAQRAPTVIAGQLVTRPPDRQVDNVRPLVRSGTSLIEPI